MDMVINNKGLKSIEKGKRRIENKIEIHPGDKFNQNLYRNSIGVKRTNSPSTHKKLLTNNMKKNLQKLRSALLIAMVLLTAGSSYGQDNLRQVISGERGKSLSVTRLERENRVTFNLSKIDDILGLDEQADLQLINSEQDQLGQNYRFRELIHGIPVENSMYIVQTENNQIRTLGGEIIVDVDPMLEHRTIARLSSTEAISSALNRVNAKKYAWEDTEMELQLRRTAGSSASNQPTAELVWYTPGESPDARDLRLAYKVIVYAIEPLSRKAYFIDALNGAILGEKDMLYFSDATGTAATVYSGTQTIHSDLNGNTYRLRDLTKGNGVITLHGETSTHTDYSSTTANWSFTTNDKYALDAHYGVSQTYAFYQVNFSRNSINNAGFALTSYVNETATTNNAYWDGSTMHFGVRSGTSAGITAIDVTGHELTHGLTQYTSNLNYSGESGAMNESMSDIFGKAVQFWSKPTDINWLLSNDMNWAIRNMANPKQYSQPNCYQGTYWYTGSADNGGVHTNSGVGNYFYYLLVNGGSATNDKGNTYSVTGLGLTAANAIIYRSETVYLTPTSNYAAWRTACINAATDLYGATSNEVTQVQNAWYAVGVGTAGGGGGSTCSAPTGLTSASITNVSATISWGNSGATSYNLQWKLSSAATWTTVSGLTTTSYALSGLTACTGYQFQVQGVCTTGSSAYSTTASFTTTGCSTSYCTSKGTNSSYEYINRIALGTINNTSGNNTGYGNFTALSTNLAGSAAATITMVPGFASATYREYWTVYIDYNHNGVFTDAGEKVVTGNGTGTVTGTFTVPSSALNGATRMRVQMKYASAASTSCTTFTYGEVEDYTVVITGNPAFSIMNNQELTSWLSFRMYPNPASDNIHLTFNATEDGKLKAEIYDATGRFIRSQEITVTNGLNDFDMSTTDLTNGVYLLRFGGEMNKTYRFLISK